MAKYFPSPAADSSSSSAAAFPFSSFIVRAPRILSFSSRICFINKAQKRNPSAAFCRSLTCSPSLLLSLFVWLSLSGLCVRVGVVWRVPVYFCFYSVFWFAWLSIKFYRRRRLLLCVLNSPQVPLPLPSSRLDTKLQKLIEQKNANSLYY